MTLGMLASAGAVLEGPGPRLGGALRPITTGRPDQPESIRAPAARRLTKAGRRGRQVGGPILSR